MQEIFVIFLTKFSIYLVNQNQIPANIWQIAKKMSLGLQNYEIDLIVTRKYIIGKLIAQGAKANKNVEIISIDFQ